MPKAKFKLEVKGFEEYMEKLDKIGGTAAMKQGVEKALIQSKEYVNPLIDAAMVKSNMPSKVEAGRYWTGRTKESLNKDMTVEWEGMTGTIDIGFNFEESGVTSIFLMRGTPKMNPVAGLEDAIYGNKTKNQIRKIQTAALTGTIDEIMKE